MRASTAAVLFLCFDFVAAASATPPVSVGGLNVQANTQANARARTGTSQANTRVGAQAQVNVGANTQTQLQRPTVQNGTGRLGQVAIPGAALNHASPAARFDTRSTLNQHARDGQRNDNAPPNTQQQDAARANSRASGQVAARGQTQQPDARTVEFRRRKAEIDRIRDEAIRTGDTQRLEDADRMENDLRAHFVAEQNQSAGAQTGGVGTPTGPGYGRMTAQAAQAGKTEVGAGLNREHKPQASDKHPGFTPGYGRLTAEQARAMQQGNQAQAGAQSTQAAGGDIRPQQ